MLYSKNLSPTLSDDLFRNPTAEYRGTPFWSWNDLLTKEELDAILGENARKLLEPRNQSPTS